ncbi:hypothetical protein FB381_2781 [Nocardioides albertanoniae]|uniref:BNR/Asp-box repeat protein n=1 Tax=Nocardioides albertanoniae TaxID=1175486 RepID=A0A543A8G3_9ACTN|nr:hypothetical protein [Nocardioides albertanoniae]TQL68882.1 hypothetical protein FB381_2781 [Nocardioides albertanoniae]
MTAHTSDRKLGLSPKARRVMLPMLALALAAMIVGTLLTRGGDMAGPVVGDDLHVVGELDGRLFVGGHGGAGSRRITGGWTQIDTLDNKDVMAWAQSGGGILAGGHAGLYRSSDGSTFAAVPGLPLSDVHALGAADERVYLGSPAGVLVSDNAGRSFQRASSAGHDLMGSIWVDPADPDVAIAPSMKSGAVKTTNGGATWAPIGSLPGSMAVAVDGSGERLVIIGMGGAESSDDGGTTWSTLDVPEGTSAAAYTSKGDLVVATMSGDRAKVFRAVDGEWDSLT